MGATVGKELEELREELGQATAKAEGLASSIDEERWTRRPANGGWSPAECLVHLNLTTEQFLPLIRDQLRRGRDQGLKRSGRYRKGLLARLLERTIEPPVKRIRVKTAPAFVPAAKPRDQVLARFKELQAELEAEMSSAEGLDLNKLKIVSPFNSRLRYNLYSCFAILTAHQRRHLWQAEQAAG